MSDRREHFNNDGMPADWQPPDDAIIIRTLRAEVERLTALVATTTELLEMENKDCERLREESEQNASVAVDAKMYGDRLRAALERIAEYAEQYWVLGDKSYQFSIIAREALYPDDYAAASQHTLRRAVLERWMAAFPHEHALCDMSRAALVWAKPAIDERYLFDLTPVGPGRTVDDALAGDADPRFHCHMESEYSRRCDLPCGHPRCSGAAATAPDALRDAIVDAYQEGARAVHFVYNDHGPSPDFAEAGHDYAASVLKGGKP